jgi:hypothetical protein
LGEGRCPGAWERGIYVAARLITGMIFEVAGLAGERELKRHECRVPFAQRGSSLISMELRKPYRQPASVNAPSIELKSFTSQGIVMPLKVDK